MKNQTVWRSGKRRANNQLTNIRSMSNHTVRAVFYRIYIFNRIANSNNNHNNRWHIGWYCVFQSGKWLLCECEMNTIYIHKAKGMHERCNHAVLNKMHIYKFILCPIVVLCSYTAITIIIVKGSIHPSTSTDYRLCSATDNTDC